VENHKGRCAVRCCCCCPDCSVLAAAGAWLGPGFKLSWQALAVVNDMLVAVVEELCQVGQEQCGDRFLSPRVNFGVMLVELGFVKRVKVTCCPTLCDTCTVSV
jgi:hypothetical protein